MIESKNIKIFFVIGHGRSGTKFLSELLNSAENALVQHENDIEDIKYFHLGMVKQYNNVVSNNLAKRFSKVFESLPENIKTYGEVNSLLRYNIDWLKENLNPLMLHLVRDGRDVVRSMYSRKVYLEQYRYIPAYPQDDDPFSLVWHKISRFEKLCWYWNHTNLYIKDKIHNYIRFEDILLDYDLLSKKILMPMEIRLTKEKWQKFINQPINATSKLPVKYFLKRMLPHYKQRKIENISHWKEWDRELTERFWEICGDTMREFGYSE